jgi:hypothetical protein
LKIICIVRRNDKCENLPFLAVLIIVGLILAWSCNTATLDGVSVIQEAEVFALLQC